MHVQCRKDILPTLNFKKKILKERVIKKIFYNFLKYYIIQNVQFIIITTFIINVLRIFLISYYFLKYNIKISIHPFLFPTFIHNNKTQYYMFFLDHV